MTHASYGYKQSCSEFRETLGLERYVGLQPLSNTLPVGRNETLLSGI